MFVCRFCGRGTEKKVECEYCGNLAKNVSKNGKRVLYSITVSETLALMVSIGINIERLLRDLYKYINNEEAIRCERRMKILKSIWFYEANIHNYEPKTKIDCISKIIEIERKATIWFNNFSILVRSFRLRKFFEMLSDIHLKNLNTIKEW